ncbi:hypothetical protein JTB14_037164 [Gonioctena quinquepunctata]|nr:hypothetical protein JTB14_037164 [Gonioctena quinquepunctata]
MCYPEYFKIRAFLQQHPKFAHCSSTTAIDTCEQMEHVPHHEAVETLSRNTKLSRSTDPLTEVSMSWSNRSGNRSEVNTQVNAFTPVCSNLSKEQSHAEDQLNTFTSTAKKVFTNKTMKAANHFPMNMTWISKENAKAGDELTILTSRRSPLSTSHENILRNETSCDNMESETCSKTINLLGNEITYLNQEIKRLQESVHPRLCSIWRNCQAMKENSLLHLFSNIPTFKVAYDWWRCQTPFHSCKTPTNSQATPQQIDRKKTFFSTLVRLRRGMAVETLEGNMGRVYLRQTERANINEDAISSAVNEVNKGNLSIRKAADKYNIKPATLQHRLEVEKSPAK